MTAKTEITNLSDFFDRLDDLAVAPQEVMLYRGHPDRTFLLKPALFREQSQRKDEKNIFRELISVQPSAFEQDRNVFEQLVRMAHFSLPTRLLDLSYNPLVSLFFACERNPEADGALLTFTAPKSSVRYFDSDTVSCLSNLSCLRGDERDQLRKIHSLDALRRSHAGKRLLQFIRAEKSYFLPEIVPEDLKGVLMVRPKQTNPRIIAQQGAFLLFGLTTELKEDNAYKIKVGSRTIPAAAKPRILRELDQVNINRAALFPEVESAARYIMSKLVPVDGGTESAGRASPAKLKRPSGVKPPVKPVPGSELVRAKSSARPRSLKAN